MKILGIALLAIIVFTGAAPDESGYSKVPVHKGLGEADAKQKSIRDESVRPEEVYKYGTQEFAVIASDTGYFPSRIIVRRNIPVRLFVTSASPEALCFVMDDFSIRKGAPAQKVEEIRLLPTKVGQYRFYCPAKEIQGTLVVRD